LIAYNIHLPGIADKAGDSPQRHTQFKVIVFTA